MKTAVFLQVRLKSSRLPGKALLRLNGKTAIEHAMEALSFVPADVFALLTDEESRSVLEPLAKPHGFSVFEGPRDDVLLRFAEASRYFGATRYIRATGDNPLVSWELTRDLIALHEEKFADFSGFLGPPLGTGVELTETRAIYIAEDEAQDPYEREHVSPFIYRRPGRFRVFRPWAAEEANLPKACVTLDTAEDYAFITNIYRALYRDKPIPIRDLVAWLKLHESEHSEHSIFTVGKTG
ncbi:MAG: acylneuraminate cytidylyltransferase [Spirochaetales bacterium]|nr:acylneuraminate cytidylyltransferase [Spirochaetales bacterium]